MSVPHVSPDDAGAVPQTVKILAGGGVVVLPTDTVYGLAALPTIAEATAKLFDRKGRLADVPIAVLCCSADQALDLADLTDSTVADRARSWADAHWPGPLTMVLGRRPSIDWNLGEPPHTIGVRVPDHDFVRAVTAEIGPLAVTSANRHGMPTPATAADAAASLTGPVDLIVDAGRLEGTVSTVVDVVSRDVLRPGAVSPLD